MTPKKSSAPLKLVQPQFRVAENIRKASAADKYVIIPESEYRAMVEKMRDV